jgi:hypothetical protein
MEQKILLLEDALSRRLYPRQEKVGCRTPKEEGEDDPLNGYYLADCGKTMGVRQNFTVRTSGTTERHPAGSSKRPDFSPAQPWRAETRLAPSKGAASEVPGDTHHTSCGPFALTMNLGERISPACASDLRESLRYVEPLSAARPPLEDFSILLQHEEEV